jgi:hypothetical protein
MRNAETVLGIIQKHWRARYSEKVRRGTRCWIIDAINKSSEEILLGHLTNLMAKV